MATNIEWTDETWNPVRGCVKVSAGCKNCYAETFAERFRGVKGHPYEQGFDLRLVPEQLAKPLSWTKPRRVFVNSMSDLFQDGVPDQYLHEVYHVMERCSQHTFQILTKRPERMQKYLAWRYGPDEEHPRGRIPSRHIWHGVSVENQLWTSRLDLLLGTITARRFVSLEPLLGPIDISPWLGLSKGIPYHARLDWVIVGGESGHGARQCDVRWVRDLVAQCQSARVPVFVKQLGARAFDSALGRATVDYATHAIGMADGLAYLRLRQSKGGDLTEWPEDLRVREWPAR